MKAMEVLSSMEMWLSSQMTVMLPSSWVPASEQAVDAAGVHGEADGGGDTGAQRAGRDLDALGVSVLGVSRRQRACGAQLLDVVKLEAEAAQVELDILGERGMASGENETVTADPSRIGRIDVHDLVVQKVRCGCERDSGAGVARARLLDGVRREELGGLHRFIVDMIPLKCHVGLQPYLGPQHWGREMVTASHTSEIVRTRIGIAHIC